MDCFYIEKKKALTKCHQIFDSLLLAFANSWFSFAIIQNIASKFLTGPMSANGCQYLGIMGDKGGYCNTSPPGIYVYILQFNDWSNATKPLSLSASPKNYDSPIDP